MLHSFHSLTRQCRQSNREDWEYPGYAPHSGTPDDTVNFNLLLDDIRDALDRLGAETGRHYGLRQRPCRV